MRLSLLCLVSVWIATPAWGSQQNALALGRPAVQEEIVLPPPSEQGMSAFSASLCQDVSLSIERMGGFKEKQYLSIRVDDQTGSPHKEHRFETISVTGGKTFQEAHSLDGSIVVIVTQLEAGEEQVFHRQRADNKVLVVIVTGLPEKCPIEKIQLSSDGEYYALLTKGAVQVLGATGAREAQTAQNNAGLAIAERGSWMLEELQKNVALIQAVVFAEKSRAVLFAYRLSGPQRGNASQKKLVEYLKVVDCTVIKSGVVGSKVIPVQGEAQPAEYFKNGEYRITEIFREKRHSFMVRDFRCMQHNLFFLEGSDLGSEGKGTVYQFNFEAGALNIREHQALNLPNETILLEWDKELFIGQAIDVLASPAGTPRQPTVFFPGQQPTKSFMSTYKWYFLAGSAAAIIALVLGAYQYRSAAWFDRCAKLVTAAWRGPWLAVPQTLGKGGVCLP